MFTATLEKIKKSERDKGIREGIQEGILKGKLKDAVKMHRKGFDLETIADIKELPMAELKKALKI